MATSPVSISDTSIENNDWSCSICTYQNQNNSSECKLCLTPRINKSLSIKIPNKTSNISIQYALPLSQSLASVSKNLETNEQDIMDDIIMYKSKPKKKCKKKRKHSFFRKKRNKSDLTSISKKKQKKIRNLSNAFERYKNRNQNKSMNIYTPITLTKSKTDKKRLSLHTPTIIVTSISAPVNINQNRSVSNNLMPQSVTSLVTTSSWNTTDNDSDSSDIEAMYDTAINVHNKTPIGNVVHKQTPMGYHKQNDTEGVVTFNETFIEEV